ncbi:Fic family protein [Duganella sp. S19_KUP01_CR8]|uniref:Fic family protein n=1 Tax=Duganella sp. S19_KUP01_CR8 TaxID=3025502 RepID=UPI002FCD7AFA
MPEFRHFDLTLLNPSFDSQLVDVLTELEYLRRLQIGGSTPAPTFFQLKHIFHMLESLGSARIEGNHTTLADYVENFVDGTGKESDQIREISNIESAMKYVEETMQPKATLTEQFIRELHDLAVHGLEREGDRTPGAYRSGPVRIAKSDHVPPDALSVPMYMRELTEFINRDAPPKYDLIKVASAHHRFGWIHPFSNGNGRVVRLVTYALLIKYGYNVQGGGRVLNPTAVFCNDRERYYEMLACADKGAPADRERWCTYVLSGILDELKKIDRLTDYAYLKEKILGPALAFSLQRTLITKDEHAILSEVMKQGIAKSADLHEATPTLSDAQRTYQIKKLVERKMLQPIREGARQYALCFTNNYLLRGVIKALSAEGFVPSSLH